MKCPTCGSHDVGYIGHGDTFICHRCGNPNLMGAVIPAEEKDPLTGMPPDTQDFRDLCAAKKTIAGLEKRLEDEMKAWENLHGIKFQLEILIDKMRDALQEKIEFLRSHFDLGVGDGLLSDLEDIAAMQPEEKEGSVDEDAKDSTKFTKAVCTCGAEVYNTCMEQHDGSPDCGGCAKTECAEIYWPVKHTGRDIHEGLNDLKNVLYKHFGKDAVDDFFLKPGPGQGRS